MFFKMLLAFIVSICLAGGVVYFGMPVTERSTSTTTDIIVPQNEQAVKLERYLDRFVKKKSAKASIPQNSASKNRPPLVSFDQLMEQADLIQATNLKDQAFLDITNYATEFNKFGAAKTAMNKIEQVELRDTARGNIAIFMARSGMSKEAFEIIDEVEIETLRDIMRLQVIEAIVLPNQISPTIQ